MWRRPGPLTPRRAVGAAVTALTLGVAFALASRGEPPPVHAAGITAGRLEVESVEATPDGFDVTIRNAGRDPQTVALVVVNDAVWPADLPRGDLRSGGTVVAKLAYHWIEGDAYEVKVIGGGGAVASGEVRPGQEEAPAGPHLPGWVRDLIGG